MCPGGSPGRRPFLRWLCARHCPKAVGSVTVLGFSFYTVKALTGRASAGHARWLCCSPSPQLGRVGVGEGWINKGAECWALWIEVQLRGGRCREESIPQVRGTAGSQAQAWASVRGDAEPCGCHHAGTGGAGHTCAEGHCPSRPPFPQKFEQMIQAPTEGKRMVFFPGPLGMLCTPPTDLLSCPKVLGLQFLQAQPGFLLGP